MRPSPIHVVIIIIVFGVLGATVLSGPPAAHASSAEAPPIQAAPAPRTNGLPPGTILISAGALMTGAGMVGYLLAIAVVVDGYRSSHRDTNEKTMGPGINLAYGGFISGIATLASAIGVPLLVAGIGRRARWKKSIGRPALSFDFYQAPQRGRAGHISMNWRF